jgi:hypothetical protein
MLGMAGKEVEEKEKVGVHHRVVMVDMMEWSMVVEAYLAGIDSSNLNLERKGGTMGRMSLVVIQTWN